MKLAYTRKIINAIHDGSLLEADYEKTPIFNLAVPTKVNGIPTEVLHPEDSVSDRLCDENPVVNVGITVFSYEFKRMFSTVPSRRKFGICNIKPHLHSLRCNGV